MGSTANKMKLNCKEGYAFEVGNGKYLFTEDGELRDLNSGKKINILKRSRQEIFSKTVHVILNNKCNLNCEYCYAGDKGNEEQKFSNIRKFLENFNKLSPLRYVNFYAGGEPTLSFDLIKKNVEWCNENIGKIRYSITTNGVLSQKNLNWLIGNMDAINVSCDGPPEIQNEQRPLKGGGRSSEIVESTINKLISKFKGNYFISCNLTSNSVDKMEKILFYFHKRGIDKADFSTLWDPFVSCKLDERITKNHFKKYGGNIMKIMELASILDMNLTTGGVLNLNLRVYHCAGCGNSTVFTLDNNIASCTGVFKKLYNTRDVFIYGKLGEKGIEINKEKLNLLKKRKGTSLNECKNCTLVRACAGQCPARALEENDTIFSVNRNLCELTRNVFHDYLVYQVHKNFIRIKPYIREGKNLEFEMVFNRFKLGDNEFRENPYMRLEGSLNGIGKKIEKYCEDNDRSVIFVSFSDIPSKDCIEFIGSLKKKRVPLFILKPIFPCKDVLFNKAVENLNVPKSCKDCLELYRVIGNDRIKFCTGQIGKKKFLDYKNRKEIYEEFSKIKKEKTEECYDCIHFLRGNCDGKYC